MHPWVFLVIKWSLEFLSVSTSMVVSVVRAGAIVFRVALVGKLRDMS